MRLRQSFDKVQGKLCPRQFVLDISREQEQAVKEEARRWGIDFVTTLSYMLIWGIDRYFKE